MVKKSPKKPASEFSAAKNDKGEIHLTQAQLLALVNAIKSDLNKTNEQMLLESKKKSQENLRINFTESDQTKPTNTSDDNIIESPRKLLMEKKKQKWLDDKGLDLNYLLKKLIYWYY